MLLRCGSCIAEMAGLKWPVVHRLEGTKFLENQSWFRGFQQLSHNYCYPNPSEDTAMVPIYKNARGPNKITSLACFDFARLKFESDMCITCIGMLPNFGQWEGNRNCVYVLENCESEARHAGVHFLRDRK